MNGGRKCLNRFLLVLFLALFALVCSGSLSGETTLAKLEKISIDLTRITNQFNQLSVNSEITLMDLQKIFPKLITEVNGLQTEVQLLKQDSQMLTDKSGQLLEKWTRLSNGILNLSNSMANFKLSLTMLGSSVKRAENKARLGLWISIGSGLLAVIMFVYYLVTSGNK